MRQKRQREGRVQQMEYTRLFQPINIGGMELKNRVVMTAVHLVYSDDGSPNDKINQFYWKRAEGGAGLLMIGGVATDRYVGYDHMLRIDKDEYTEKYQTLVDGIHKRGAKVGIEFLQTGRYGRSAFVDGDDSIIAPSASMAKISGDMPREMTKADIQYVCDCTAAAAVRAKQAGFDCIEMTAASGYLISQFLSPVTNHREDEYGGTLENRMRFPLEMVAAVRRAVGDDYPLAMRVGGNEFVSGGNTNVECIAFCKKLQEAGIDLLDVTGGWHETKIPQLTGDLPEGGFTYLAANIKNEVSIPVLSANRHANPVEAETTLALGQADLIGLMRPLLADPAWPNKVQHHQEEDVRPCMACNQGCLANVFAHKPCKCLMNSYVGREYLGEENRPAQEKKHLLVVGGGPAGCEFALRAAKRGHDVCLWEASDKLCGRISLVAAPPAKQTFLKLAAYFNHVLYNAGVKVELNKNADAAEIEHGKFDAVVVATGSTIRTLNLQGNSKITICTAEDILSKRVIAGKHVVVIGGSSVGCETADYLAQEGALTKEKLFYLGIHQAESFETMQGLLDHSSRHISIVDMEKIGGGFDFGCGWPVMKDLKRLQVAQYARTSIVGIEENGVVVKSQDPAGGEKQQVLPCDTIVMAVGYRSNAELYNTLRDRGVSVYCIGNAESPGNIMKAIHEADRLSEVL